MTRKRIIIIGGGFAGVRTALDLSHHVYKDAEIVLIDQTGYHQYHPDFYRIATTFLPERKSPSSFDFQNLFHESTIALSAIIPQDKVRLLTEKVVDIDANKNMVIFSSGAKMTYDWLVLASGSVSNYFNIAGIEEYAYTLKSASDALNIRNEIDELFFKKAKKDVIHIVIGGGGFTGCELAAALASYAKRLAQIHSHPRHNIKITIIEAGKNLLPGASLWAQEKAKKRLNDLGVALMFGNPVHEVTPTEIHINHVRNSNKNPYSGAGAISNGAEHSNISLLYDIFIWTAGVKAHPLAERITGARRGDKSCLIVDEYLRVEPFENIFAVGDMSFCREDESTDPLPMTAQVAISQGKYVAYTLKRLIHKKRLFRYHFHVSRFVIPLGDYYALADFGWIRFSGYVGWILRRMIDLNYYTTILPWRAAWERWRCKL